MAAKSLQNPFRLALKGLFLLALVPLSSCQGTSASDFTNFCHVVIESGADFRVDASRYEVQRGKDLTFQVRCLNGSALVSLDYPAYDLSAKGSEYTVTLRAVRYSCIVALYLSYENVTYFANGGERLDGIAPQIGVLKPLSREHLRGNSADGSTLFSREGYTQIGWNTAADGSGEEITFGARFDLASSPVLYAEWAKNGPESDFTYTLHDHAATLLSYQGNAAFLVVPPRLGGAPLTLIAGGAFEGSSSKSVYLPSSLLGIQANAFLNARLETLYLCDNLKSVSDESFAGCDALKTLKIEAVLPPVYSGTYFDAFTDKMDYLNSIQTKKKIVLFSGSSGRYGYSTPRFLSAYPDYAVANLGTFAFTNAKPQLELIRHRMRGEDVLLEAPEFDALPYQFATTNDFNHTTFALFESDYGLLSELDLRGYSKVFSSFQTYQDSRKSLEGKSYFVSAKHFDDEGNPIAYPTYNLYGDYTLLRPNSAKDIALGSIFCPYTTSAIMSLEVNSLNALLAPFLQAGIKVYFSFTPRNRSSLTPESTLAKRAELENFLRANVAVPVISSIEDYLYSGVYFYKIDSHLSDEGVQLRMDQILKDLSRVL